MLRGQKPEAPLFVEENGRGAFQILFDDLLITTEEAANPLFAVEMDLHILPLPSCQECPAVVAGLFDKTPFGVDHRLQSAGFAL